ncbi:TonB-dependent hemoglobin/transferrin/lactoferrin family receptor [Aestuariivirga sp.]|uniref:TonB-dependent hemoglobin/transferrin/lactoferrin family receptor n=1 Tax=Aestuariivirga sp. TaxID=2650926 RepID=UPI0039E4AB67
MELDLITVTVLKIKQALSSVAGGVSVVSKEEKDRHGNATVADVLAPIPGVSTEQSANDPATAINIRGLQDFGRVAVTVDGARQNFQRTGHNADGMFYLEPEQLQQVSVTRGPIANVYGSGAIGGVVSFDTLDALSFLRDDEEIAGSEKVTYNTNGKSILSSTTGALRLGDYGGILGNIVYRDNGDYEDGDGNTVADSNREVAAGLAKLSLTPTADSRLDVSYLVNTDDFENGTATSRYGNEVKAETLAAKLNWEAAGNDWIDFTASSYWTSTHQDQERLTASNPALIGLHRTFDIDTVGFDLFNTSRFSTGGLQHVLTIGGDAFHDDVKVVDPISTADLFTPSGERTAGGAFVQDQVDVTQWMQVIVAGRYDVYSLTGTTVDSDGSHFSPKATLVLKPFENTALKGLHFYGTYAEGYRAPSTTETMIGGFHPAPAPFQFLPNPDLKPEIAENLEAGITGQFSNVLDAEDALSIRAGIFRNNVDDYIGAQYLDNGTPANLADDTYQYVNIAKAELWGVEGEVSYDAGFMFASVAASMIRGKDKTADDWLLTAPADKVVSTLGVRFLDEKATLGARWFAVAAQDRVPTGGIPADAYNLVNLFASYQVNDSLKLALNAENIFNEDYRRYLDGTDSSGRSMMFTVETRLGR